ncbi:Uncharacterised protein [Mycobacterium tuberculosis]|nr:Uncharacterised protein [Mycobacterium tuberculosis]
MVCQHLVDPFFGPEHPTGANLDIGGLPLGSARIIRGEKQQLGDNGMSQGFVDGAAEENDPVFQQPGIDIVRSFAAVGLFDHGGNQVHHSFSPFRQPFHGRKGVRVV